MKIGIIATEFNTTIVDALIWGAETGLKELGVEFEVFRVPGAFEIPLFAQELAKTERFTGLITLGVVIEGQTDHYRLVCDGYRQGIQRVMLDHGLPIVGEVLMVKNAELAKARARRIKDENKGYSAAHVVHDMAKKLIDLA